MLVQLAPQVLYRGTVAGVSFGRIPKARLVEILASGRLCGVLLEDEIAARFGIETGTQGDSADLIDGPLGGIQMKTYRSTGAARFKSGTSKGQLKADRPAIWTTKSSYWDRASHLTPAQLAEATAYFDHYDHFMYVDISQMLELRYSLVVVPASQVKAQRDGFYISESAILSNVSAEVDLEA